MLELTVNQTILKNLSRFAQTKTPLRSITLIKKNEMFFSPKAQIN